MGQPSWRAINATTAQAALVGILLGPRSAGRGRAPARPAGGAAGLGGHRPAGPDAAAGAGAAPAAVARDQAAGAAPAWSYEQLLVIVSLGSESACRSPGRHGRGGLPPARRHQAVLSAGGHRRDRPRPAGRPRPLVARLDPEHGGVVAGRRLDHPSADRPARPPGGSCSHDGRLGRLGDAVCLQPVFSLRAVAQASPESPVGSGGGHPGGCRARAGDGADRPAGFARPAAHSAAPRPTPSNRAAIEEAELHLFRYIDG
jgi:hypothetical protein